MAALPSGFSRFLDRFRSIPAVNAQIARRLESATNPGEMRAEFLHACKHCLKKGQWGVLADLVRDHGGKVQGLFDGADGAFGSRIAEAADTLKRENRLPEAVSLCLIFGIQAKVNELRFEHLLCLGQFAEAEKLADAFPDDAQSEIIAKIREAAERSLLVNLRDGQFEQAMADTPFCADPAAMADRVVQTARSCILERAHANPPLEALRREYRRLASLEAQVGHFGQAARIAEEILKDAPWAAELYEKANLYHRAIALVEGSDAPDDGGEIKRKLAALHKNGGNLLEAARLYEELRDYREAAPIYEELELYGKALDCLEKSGDADTDRLVELRCKCGRAEEAVELLLRSGQIPDIERAKKLSADYHLPELEQKASALLEKIQNGSLEEARGLVAAVDAELVETYAPILGIDFGTTNSVCALFNKKSRSTEIVPVPGSEDGWCEPSCWGLDGQGVPLNGEAARRHALLHPEDVVFCSKRLLGEKHSEVLLRGRKYRPEEIAASVIDHVRQNALDHLQAWRRNCLEGQLRQRRMPLPSDVLDKLIAESRPENLFRKAVLTVPAFYDSARKQATRTAAEIAGIEVVRLMHEPTAAAVKRFIGKTGPHYASVAVVDLGGGTLDLSFMEIGDGVYDVKSVYGNIRLGGKDIDDLLLAHALKDIKTRYNVDLSDPRHESDLARLRDGCENLKIQLSLLSDYAMALPHFLGLPEYRLDLTREKLESVIQPFLQKLRETLEKAVADAKSNATRPDQVVLVGNATRMPAVARLVSSVFGMDVKASPDAGTIVAAGAALQGAVLSGNISLLLLDVVPYSLNIVVKDRESGKQVCQKMIERNTTIPTRKADVFSTASDNQTIARIEINQGESASPEENCPLGSVELRDIPPAKAGESKITVTYDIGVDCILEVTAKEEATGKIVSARVENSVMLGPGERATLQSYFADRKQAALTRKRRDNALQSVQELLLGFEEAQKRSERENDDFSALFQERVERHPGWFKASKETFDAIQEMFLGKDDLQRKGTRILDQTASIRHHLGTKAWKDMQDGEAIRFLGKTEGDLKRMIEEFQKEVLAKRESWIHALRGMQPDADKLSPADAARALMDSGDHRQAKTLWKRLLAENGRDPEAYRMLLRCDVKLGEFRDYREDHRKYGSAQGVVYPDFDALDGYLASIRDSVFLVACPSGGGVGTGTAFAVGNHWLATCRHVVGEAPAETIRIVGHGRELRALDVKLGSKHDIALIRVAEEVSPLRLGEFPAASPGESVLAIGFPKPDSMSFEENLSVSRGVVNSVRQAKNGRLIYMDAKIAGGNSGGPLLNGLGEVIGVNTFIIRHFTRDNGVAFTDFEQPVAVPTWLMRNWIETTAV